MKTVVLIALICGTPALADTVVPAHTIRARTLISATDLLVRNTDVPGALSDPGVVIGREAKVALYAGRPIRAIDIGPPALVRRNQVVTLSYRRGPLTIRTDVRTLGRAAAGERIQVMNISSKTTLFATVLPDGTLQVDE